MAGDKLADCQTYVKTLHQIHLHCPALIPIPDTFLSSKDNLVRPSSGEPSGPGSTSLLVQCLYDDFPGVPVEHVLRKYWNEDAGTSHVYISEWFLYLLNLKVQNSCLNSAFGMKNERPLYWPCQESAYTRPTLPHSDTNILLGQILCLIRRLGCI